MTPKADQTNHTNAVLVGGGHAHVEVIRQYGLKPWPGVRLTLVSESARTPYSGMLPGWVAGHYSEADAHINLRKLCTWAGVEFLQDSVIGVDQFEQQVQCSSHQAIPFDYLSINAGATRELSTVAGAAHNGLPVKPISHFMHVWGEISEALRTRQKLYRICLVGGGAAGVEVICALDFHLRRIQARAQTTLTLVDSGNPILQGYNASTQRRMRHLLLKKGIDLKLGCSVVEAHPTEIVLADASRVPTDLVVWALPAGAPPWLADTGLALDERGFIAVRDTLQSVSHPHVFAAGDCASLTSSTLPKSGVYAVRQGPVLAKNLRAATVGEPLSAFKPQRRFLSLLSTGGQHALASWGPLTAAGRWAWRLKHFIDTTWMKRYERPSNQ